jgi:hypothetical protein
VGARSQAVPAPRTEGLEIQVLCQHHDPEPFLCGDPAMDAEIRALRQEVPRDLARDLSVYVLAGNDAAVRAFICLMEITIEDEETASGSLWFFVPAIGVATDLKQSDAFWRLCRHAFEIVDIRRAGSPDRFRAFRGIACQSDTNTKLRDVLSSLRFVPHPTSPFYMVRTFDDYIG